jgi:hypothetical protein
MWTYFRKWSAAEIAENAKKKYEAVCLQCLGLVGTSKFANPDLCTVNYGMSCSTTALKQHMKHNHRDIVTSACAAASIANQGRSTRVRSSTSLPSQRLIPGGRMDGFVQSWSNFYSRLVKWVIMENIPFEMVEDESFREMVYELNPKADQISRDRLTTGKFTIDYLLTHYCSLILCHCV